MNDRVVVPHVEPAATGNQRFPFATPPSAFGFHSNDFPPRCTIEGADLHGLQLFIHHSVPT